ncbi:glycosyltransferase family 2 protein [Mycoplasmoides alvi]|uniref:glycosyltransferase family 2 protein n=1 Tax=Mycoplasmoides alvi TaxID=78580 RepID=UPI000698AE52|nr:glycosyltransferase family 2 protein [Mycoplasmoides alvi]
MTNTINTLFIISIVFSLLSFVFNFFEYFLALIGIFKKRAISLRKIDFLPNKKIAVLIAARNEENVIKDIVNSLLNQTYNKNFFHIYLVADNCTDNTAKIVQKIAKKFPNRITVLERFNDKYRGANFAIQYAIKYIRKFINIYDAYCYFDSDNIVDKHWLKEVVLQLNKGYDVVTSYRNSINFKDNWISASYAIQFIKESNYINASRNRFNMTSWINGTGFCFSEKVLQMSNDWDFNTLSHDIEFTQFLSINNIKCGYANDAIIYDEQPIKFKDSYAQRLRWSKGFFQVFKLYSFKEVKQLFLFWKKENKNIKSIYANLALIFPQVFLFLTSLFLYVLISILLSCVSNNELCKLIIIPWMFWIYTPIAIFSGLYLTFLVFALAVVIQEKKRIDCKLYKGIIYAFMYPFFMFTYVPISIICIFSKKVSVNPIKRKTRI